MRDSQSRLIMSARPSMLFMSACCAALMVVLSSCSANLPVQREAQQVEGGALATSYSIAFFIHGDNYYLYHDTNGNEYKADEKALAGAKRVAEQNPHAEVFIFHQKPKRHFLFFFSLRDGEFYYYRNGRLIANELYRRDQEQSHFNPEVELYHRFRTENQSKKASVFVYLGHEIPEIGGAGYDASYPDRTFTIHDFANGLKDFTNHSARFDLMVLSTCFGGTPYTIGAVGSLARYIIASPDNLHLSYFDLHSLERLDLSLQDGDMPAFAKRYARKAFDRLTMDVQTAVSVAVYDVDRVQGFLQSVRKVYDYTLTSLKEETQVSKAPIERCDCADLPAYVLPTMNEGVDVFYRSARFGRSNHKQNHSGWECRRKRGTQDAASQSAEPALE